MKRELPIAARLAIYWLFAAGMNARFHQQRQRKLAWAQVPLQPPGGAIESLKHCCWCPALAFLLDEKPQPYILALA